MRTVEIPGGQATLRERSELTVGQRRLVKRAMMAAGHVFADIDPDLLTKAVEADRAAPETDAVKRAGQLRDIEAKQMEMSKGLKVSVDDADLLLDVEEATIVAVLESWTLERELPTLDTVGGLPVDLYDVLAEATKHEGASLARGDAAGFEPSLVPDQSPTGGSSGSKATSKVATNR